MLYVLFYLLYSLLSSLFGGCIYIFTNNLQHLQHLQQISVSQAIHGLEVLYIPTTNVQHVQQS
jgi:hypothetical protein